MNSYIINPLWFYLIDLTIKLSIALCVFGSLFIIASIVFGVIYLDKKECGYREEVYMTYKKVCKKFFVVSIICFFITLFIPSKETYYEMMVSSIATKENITMTVDAVKEMIDYIDEKVGGDND